jgi:hypothetical protein
MPRKAAIKGNVFALTFSHGENHAEDSQSNIVSGVDLFRTARRA